MSFKKRVREITIPARQMINVSIGQILWDKTPPRERGRRPTLPLGRGVELRNLSRLWTHIGERFRSTEGGDRLLISVPQVDALEDALQGGLGALTGIRAELSVAVREDDFSLFETLTEEQYNEVISGLRHDYAWASVYLLLNNWLRAKLEVLPREAGDAALKAQVDEQRQIMQVNLREAAELLAIFDWSVQTQELPDDQQFLPPGFWPCEEARGQAAPMPPAEDEQLELGEAAIELTDERIDRDRDGYYMGELRCTSRLEARKWFGGRRYVAYIYSALSSELLALLDCATPGNAAYIFRVGTPVEEQPDAWKTDAGRTKWELLTRPEERRGTFVRRFIHAAGWQVRLKEWLEDSFPARQT